MINELNSKTFHLFEKIEFTQTGMENLSIIRKIYSIIKTQ